MQLTTSPREEFSASIFQDAVLVSLTMRRPGNAKQLEIPGMTDTRADWVSAKKRLIDGRAFTACNKAFNRAKDATMRYRVPCSIIKEGIYLLPVAAVAAVDAELTTAAAELATARQQFAQVEYAGEIEKARAALGQYFSESDYPAPAEMESKFQIEWTYLSVGVPTNLPSTVQQGAAASLNGQIEAAFPAIRRGLRDELTAYLSHAVDKLEEYGPKKRLHESAAIGDILRFASDFPARDLTKDTEFAAVVADAERAAAWYDVETLRSEETARQRLSEAYRAALELLDVMELEPEAETIGAAVATAAIPAV